jgi:hypothetical protein
VRIQSYVAWHSSSIEADLESIKDFKDFNKPSGFPLNTTWNDRAISSFYRLRGNSCKNLYQNAQTLQQNFNLLPRTSGFYTCDRQKSRMSLVHKLLKTAILESREVKSPIGTTIRSRRYVFTAAVNRPF